MIVSVLSAAEPRPRRLALGSFDGVHLGHREVIRGADTVLTFEPHPRSVTDPGGVPRLLTTFARKVQLIADLGAEEIVVIPFDKHFSTQTARQFHDEVLVGKLGATRVSVGANFRYGTRAQGNTELLLADGRFAVRVVPLLEVDGGIVSSSRIRGLVAGGDVESAGELLGAPFSVMGEVTRERKRRRTLGCSTANLELDRQYAAPAHGVYACRVHPAGVEEPVAAVASVDPRPECGTGVGDAVEVHLIDRTGDLCGREVRIEFHKRLRGAERFGCVDRLLEHVVDRSSATVNAARA